MKMTRKSWIAIGSFIASAFVVGGLFQNCSSPELESGSVNNSNSSSSASKFAIVPSTADIMVGNQQPFVISGGVTPYTWSLSPSTCGGFDTATKTFTAASVGGVSCTLSIKDGSNKIVRAVINIAQEPLVASYTPNPASISSNISLMVMGGKAPYTYTLVSGGGQLVSSVYKSPASAETAKVRVTDADGNTYDVSIKVGAGGSTDTGGAGTKTIVRTFQARFGDFMLSRQQGEGAAVGYVDVAGANLTVFSAGSSTRNEIRRCWTRANHFAVIVPIGTTIACSGFDEEGSLGFVSKASASDATRQLFSCANGRTSFLTTNSAECGSVGFSSTAVGFVP